MAIRVTDLKRFEKYLSRVENGFRKAQGRALVHIGQDARAYAIENAKKQFKGDASGPSGRRLTGQLFNRIRVIFEISKVKLPKVFLAVIGIPYGAIHEFGGTIVPRKAKNLWIKIDYKSPYKRFTPSEFMKRRNANNPVIETNAIGKSYRFIKTSDNRVMAAEVKTYKKAKPRVRGLFVLAKRVEMPARPYLTPAAEKAAKGFKPAYLRYLREEF